MPNTDERTNFEKLDPTELVPKRIKRTAEVSYAEDFDEETSIFRKLCLLPMEPIWYNFIIVIGLGNSIEAMINGILTASDISGKSQFHQMFYIGDMAWCFNTALCISCNFMKDLKSSTVKFPKRNVVYFAIDFLSILPFELLFPPELQGYAALNKTLKIFFIMYIFHFVNSLLESSVTTRAFQMVCELIYFILLLALICAFITKAAKTKQHGLIEMVYIVTDQITGRGFGLLSREHYYLKWVLLMAQLIIFVGVILICTANVTFLFLSTAAEKSNFSYKFKCLKDQLKRKQLPMEFIDCLESYFDTLWTDAGGIEELMGGRRKYNLSEKYIPKMLSRIFYAEITIDMFTGIFKHSLLLKDLPLPFLRDLSPCITREVYLKNQYIYKLDELKDKMIFIFKGTIEIISDEDGETPLMTMSSGTCISEICLYFPYKSTCLVRCSSTCIFHILRRNDFTQLIQKYKKIQFKMRSMVNQRFEDGQTIKKIQSIYNTRADQKIKCTNMCWLVFMLHKLMAIAHPYNATHHTKSSLRLERFINDERFRNHIFTPNYLSLYAVPEVLQENNDTLFAKSTFPYVFKPNTGLTLFWEMFIASLAMIAGLIIPYYALTFDSEDQEHSRMLYSVIYFFTGIWFLDIIIQVRIFIIYENRLVSKFSDIVIMKLTNIIFITDLISVLPFELYSSVFAPEGYENYVYMNRILKLARVIRLLKKWDAQYNSNPLIVRLVCSLLFLIYCVFIFSCVFYYIGYLEHREVNELRVLFFYTTQILTGVSLWVQGYSDLPKYQLVNMFLFIFIVTVYVIMYGMIFSAYAFMELAHLKIKHNTKALIRAAKAIDKRYEYYIDDVVHDIITIDHGFGYRNRGYFYNSLPKEWIGYFYDVSYRAYIEELPIFSGIPPVVLREIFESCGYTRNYNAHEILYHIGDLGEDLFILIRGECEVVHGESLRSTYVKGVHELNSLEIFLLIPMRSTVITLTHCRLLRIKYKVMREVLSKHQTCWQVRGPLSGLREFRAKILYTPLHYYIPDVLSDRKKELWMQSQVIFSRTSPTFLHAYEVAGLFRLRWMFMNLSFSPQGEFLQIWECVRCICAILSALLSTSITFSFYKVPHPIAALKWLLDFMAFLDLYVRGHVAYYDSHGILITHPCKTIVHYIQHGLAVDLFAALPLHIAVYKTHYFVLNFNKVLQLHRYLHFMKYKTVSTVTPLGKIYMFALIPAMIICINIVANIMLLLNCSIDMSESSIECMPGSIFAFKDRKPFATPNEAHIYAIYVVLSITSKVAIQGFSVEGAGNKFLVGFLSFVGFFWDTINAARIFGYYINDYINITHNDMQMRLFNDFMKPGKNKHSPAPELTALAKETIKRVWALEGTNVHKHLISYPSNLRRDILFDRFGHILTRTCLMGATDIQPFIRNLLVHSRYKIIDKFGLVQQTNDICGHTIIIFRGIVLIDTCKTFVPPATADSNVRPQKVCVCLGPGSIIGNLCPIQYNRLKDTMTATCIIELLYIKTNKFFEIMQHFPSCGEIFHDLRCVHMTHVPGSPNFEHPIISKRARWVIYKYENLVYFIINVLNFFGAYLALMQYFFEIIAADSQIDLYIVYYDICYVAALVLIFYMPLTNEKGDLMTKTEIITKFFTTWLFVVSVIGAIPMYLMVPRNIDQMSYFYINTALRTNVLLRYFFFWKILSMFMTRVPSIMFLVNFIVNILMMLLFICGTTALVVCISEIADYNMNVKIRMRSLLGSSLEHRYQHMMQYLYVMVNVFTHTSQPLYYPIGMLFIVFFIIVMSMAMVYNTVIYSRVVSMVQSLHQLKWNYLMQKKKFMTIMNLNNVSTVLIDRVNLYCGTIWHQKKGYKIPSLFFKLPNYLREPIYEDIIGWLFEDHVYFNEIHYDLKRQIYTKLKIEYFFHGDFVVYEGTIDHTMYFVMKGRVVRLARDNNVVVEETLRVGRCFGLTQGVLDNVPHDHSYRATVDSIIVYLVKKDWEHMLTYYPVSKDIIMHQANKIKQTNKEHFD